MRISMWVASAATLTMLAMSVVPGMATDDSKYNALKRFGQVKDLVKRFYVDDVSESELIDNALKGMLQSLDPHSTFMDVKEHKAMQEVTSGEFSGIGIEITQDESGVLRVVSPIEDTPAWRAGLKSGDLILEVNGEPTQDLGMSEAVSKIKGPRGTTVTLTILAKDARTPKEVKIERDTIPLISVKTKELAEGYLWLRVTNFSEHTTDALYEKLNNYTSSNELKGVILDLRNNPGGLLTQAVSVSDAFLQEGVVVSYRGRATENRDFSARKQPNDITQPMVVLLNAGSASASEIVAGALRDHKRALLIGERSFGKGSVQNIIPLADGSAVKMTTALYYTPNGTSIQAEGIQPDIVIPFERIDKDEKDENKRHRIRESNLAGHLENGNGDKQEDSKAQGFTITEDAQNALDRDNQLRMALQLVKALPQIQAIK